MKTVNGLRDIVEHIRNRISDVIEKRNLDIDTLEEITGRSYYIINTRVNGPYNSFEHPDILIDNLIDIAGSLGIKLKIE